MGQPDLSDAVAERSIRAPSAVAAAVITAVAVIAGLLAASPVDAANGYKLQVKEGSIGDGQVAHALAVRDNSGTSDNWNGYVEFIPDDGRHRSLITIRPTGSADPAAPLELSWNYRGPAWGYMAWLLEVRNQETKKWERVFTNRGVTPWVWTPGATTLPDAAPYLNAGGKVKFRFRSKSAIDVAQLDELTVTFGQSSGPGPIPADAAFDYQIGQPYQPPTGVGVVSRDWFDGSAAAGIYNICYVNAFQTQDDSPFVDRPDERSNWPADLVLDELGEDPNWGGEYLIDISTETKRTAALTHLRPMIETCATKGFDAVEFDNLDSWTRFDGTPLEDDVPFGKAEAMTFATDLTTLTHGLGMASGQKNTAELTAGQVATIGFDFAVVESCGRWNECEVFTDLYGDQVVAIEYRDVDFTAACAAIGDQVSVVRRDVAVTAPGSATYVYDEC